MLCKRQFVILIGKPGDGKSTIARNLAKTFLNARLVDNVVIPESPQEHIQCDKGQKQLIIFEDIFKNCEAAVDLGAVFDSVLKMLNEDCYSNTYVVMTSRSNEYVCSLPDLRLLEHIKCLIEIFVVEIKTTRKEAIEIFRSYVLLCGPEHSERKFSNLEHNHQIENDFIPFSFRSIQAIIKCIADTKMMEVNEQNGIKNITDKGMFGDLVIVTRSCNLMREIFSGIPSEIMLSFLRVSENIWFGEPDYQACDSESRQLCKILMTYLSESESTTDFLLQSTQLCDESYSLTQALVTKENSTKMCLCQLELQSGLFGEFTFPKLVIAVNFLPALEIRCLYQETVSSKVSTLLNEFFPDYCLKLDFCYGILKASTGFQHSNIGKETEIQTNAVCGGVINVPDVEIEKDKEPERTEKSETDTGVSAKRMVKQLETKSEGEFDSFVLSGQHNDGEQNLLRLQSIEDRDCDLSLLPNFDLICEDENTPNLDEVLLDKFFNEDGEYRNREKNRHLFVDVRDSHESSVQVHPGVTDVDTASKGGGECTNSDRNEKVPENEVELKETDETEKQIEGDIENISEDMAKPSSHDAPRWKDAGNICTVRNEKETEKETMTIKNNMVHDMVHESSLQEKTFESSKDKSSLMTETKKRNWPFIGANFTGDSYCISSGNFNLTKKEKDLINQQKFSQYHSMSKQCFEENHRNCEACVVSAGTNCLCVCDVLEEMRTMRESLLRVLDQTAKELQDSVECLRKSTVVAKVTQPSSKARNSSHSVTKSDDENTVYVSTHVRMDYDTLLDQKLDIELEENDSETEVKQRDTSSQELSMHSLKLPIISEEDVSLGDEQEYSSSSDARKLSLSEADEISSFYPETVSCFQGRSNVTFDDSLIESYTQMNTIPDNHSEEECDKSLCNGGANVTESLDHNEQNAVPNAFPGQEENCSDDGIFSNDVVTEDSEIRQSVRDDICNSLVKMIEKSSSITCHKTDLAIEPITMNTNDSLTMCLSVDPNETEISSMSANHDLQNEVPKDETRHRDFLEEEDNSFRENIIIDSVVDRTSIEEVLENFSVSFSQEVMKEFEISIERNGLLQRRRNGMSKGVRIKESDETYFIANAENDEYLEHENHPEKEDTAQRAASIEKLITCDTITPIFGDDGELCDLVSSEKECVDKEYFGTMSESQGNKEEEMVADLCSYCFSTCCTPCDSYEGLGNVDESLSSNTSTEYFLPTVMKSRLRKQRIGKTRRISRHRPGTVKPSEMEESVAYLVPAWEKRSRKIRKRCQENRYQRKMHSEYSTQLSMNDRMNGSKQNKKKEVRSLLRHKRYGTRMGQGDEITRIDKSANCGTFYNSLYESNERPASSIQRKEYLFTEVDVKHENVRHELCNDQTGHGQEYGKLQYQVIEDIDSGIFSSLTSARYSILKEHDKFMKSLSSKGRDRKKKLRKRHRELDRLDSELNSFLRSLERIVEKKVTNDVVAFPGLQQYFEKLNGGQTPSLQEQMPYEWLRLISFSNYTGGGSPVHLARNGFYHSHNNETRCFSCNISHAGWTYSDNVQEVHRRISPNCPLVNGGIESNGNISIESGTRENQPSQAPANLGNGTGVRQGAPQLGYNTERPAIPANHGAFASGNAPRLNFSSQSTNTTTTSAPTFSFNPPVTRQDPSEFRFPQTSNQLPSGVPNLVGQSAAAVTTSGATAFSFSAAANTPEPAGFRFPQSTSQQTGGSDLTSQLRALTIQQSTGIQQPSDEPISGNPVIAPTQPLQIARQADGDTQLSISAQLPPETSDLPQTTTSNQRPSEPSGSAPPAQRTENADLIQITQLKHPRYSTMAVRMSSFRSWPNYLNQTARQMAYAGFFHPGVADFARCFCCGGGLRNWEADDDPMVEHARWYPRCEYINKLKGTHFVQAVLRRHREHMAERQREQETAQNTFSTPDPMSTSVAANLLEMGFTQERAREAILTVRRLRERSEVSIEEVTAWMLDDGNAPQQDPAGTDTTVGPGDTVGNAPPQPPGSQTPASSGSSSFESAVAARQDSDGHGSIEDSHGGRSSSLGSTGVSQGATGRDKKEDKPPKDKPSKTDSSDDEKGKSSKEDYSSDDKSKKDEVPDEKKPKSKKDKKSKSRKGRRSPVPGEVAAAAEVDTKSLKEENKLLKQMQVCKICMDKYVSVTFLPCGHLVCCEDCAKNMRKCPICRKRIKGQVRTFMS